MAIEDFKGKLKLDGTDIVDVIQQTTLPNIGTAGAVGNANNKTITISEHNGVINGFQNGTITIPYFSVDSKGRVVSKGNSTVTFASSATYYNYYNYYNYYQYSSGD